jgi:hypothetical protein
MPTPTTRKLRVELDDQALIRKGAKLAELEQSKAQKQNRYRLIGRQHRAEVKELDETIDGLVEDINNRSEERDVECRQVVDEQSGTLRTYRVDTDELVEERALTAEERDALPPPPEPQGDGSTKVSSARIKAERAKRKASGNLEVVESP